MDRWLRCSLSAAALLAGCSAAEEAPDHTPQQEEIIRGRGLEGRQLGIYTMRTPASWIRKDPLPDDLVTDTTKAICEFIINDPQGIIRIAVHNFPADSLEARIPPQAQVARWQGQIENFDAAASSTTPIAFGGYSGLLFVGSGTNMIIAASLQLPPEHFRNLPVIPTEEKETSRRNSLHEQMRADVTIKAFGPKETMLKHKDEIIEAIQSFALVDEIPHPR